MRCFGFNGGYTLTTRLIELLCQSCTIYDEVPIWRLDAVEEIVGYHRETIKKCVPARYRISEGRLARPLYWGVEDILELIFKGKDTGPVTPHNRDEHKAQLKEIVTDLVLCGVTTGTRTGGLHPDILRWIQASVCGVGYWEIISSRIDLKSPTLGSFLPDEYLSIDYLREVGNWLTSGEILDTRKRVFAVSLVGQLTESEEKVDDFLSLLGITKEVSQKAIPKKVYDKLRAAIRQKKGERHVGQVL